MIPENECPGTRQFDQWFSLREVLNDIGKPLTLQQWIAKSYFVSPGLQAANPVAPLPTMIKFFSPVCLDVQSVPLAPPP